MFFPPFSATTPHNMNYVSRHVALRYDSRSLLIITPGDRHVCRHLALQLGVLAVQRSKNIYRPLAREERLDVLSITVFVDTMYDMCYTRKRDVKIECQDGHETKPVADHLCGCYMSCNVSQLRAASHRRLGVVVTSHGDKCTSLHGHPIISSDTVAVEQRISHLQGSMCRIDVTRLP